MLHSLLKSARLQAAGTSHICAALPRLRRDSHLPIWAALPGLRLARKSLAADLMEPRLQLACAQQAAEGPLPPVAGRPGLPLPLHTMKAARPGSCLQHSLFSPHWQGTIQ